ncbi:hypothetical protein KDY119_01531 [Luteimicrobium xylanilyticum]|uniref:Uncharacterized protein n=1 Tax=Luteimicrobium xylanilyticum TaxID=1133546 RepID=A0A5P9QC43_9MICO|nr:hypothetical protein KDY119_01531 [Luteimicrobium xylanilyticum]
MGRPGSDAHVSTGVGSCWTEGSGGMLVPVRCSHGHAYGGSVSTPPEIVRVGRLRPPSP